MKSGRAIWICVRQNRISLTCYGRCPHAVISAWVSTPYFRITVQKRHGLSHDRWGRRSRAPSFVVPAAPTWTQTAITYLGLGVEHILLGIDHLLFVLALLLLVRGWRQVIVTITAFTAAHSLTLAAATLGFVSVPQRPVEAVIALSIVLVAAEVVHRERDISSWAQQWPWLIAFVFGLLHGFGFAGALNEIGLPQQAIPLALLFFNVGVELGQILFIVAVFALWAILHRIVVRLPKPITSYGPAYAIGTVAAFWTIERIAGF